jgi:hypothetical protein
LLAPSGFPARRLVNQETFEQLLPLAYHWAKTQKELILARGAPLTSQHRRRASNVVSASTSLSVRSKKKLGSSPAKSVPRSSSSLAALGEPPRNQSIATINIATA